MISYNSDLFRHLVRIKRQIIQLLEILGFPETKRCFYLFKKRHSENEDRLDTKPSVSFITIWLKPILEIEAWDGLLKIIILEYCQTFLQTSWQHSSKIIDIIDLCGSK